jgi:glycosyltransferase involved in cell wall biosynthesis
MGTITAFRRDQETADHQLDMIQPSIVHGQGAGHDGIVAKRSGFPSTITIHGIMAEELKHLPKLGQRLRYRVMNAMSEKYCIDKASHTILISPYVGRYYEGRINGTLHSVPNPVAPTYFDVVRNEEPGRILFAGRVMPLKGISDLIGAFGRLARSQDCQLRVAGSLDDRQYADRLRGEARSSTNGRYIHFLGLLDSKSLLSEFSRASMLVLPSYQETAPMVIQEAMAAGLPVVATRVGGTAHQVIEGETGFLVDAGDIDALTARMETLLADAAMRRSFGAAGKAVADREFRAAAVADKTVAVYRRILQR